MLLVTVAGMVLVFRVVAGLLGQESLELGAEFLTAWQILVVRQKGSVLLSGNERIVLALKSLHHLSDLGGWPRPAR